MKVCSDVMTSNPSCCVPDDAVVTAAQKMKTENVGSIPVVEDKKSGMLIGIITDRDIAVNVVAESADPLKYKVGDAMTRNLVVCQVSDPVENVLDAMAEHQVRRIPVVDRNKRIVGIISQGDVAVRLKDPILTGEVVAEISSRY